MHVGFLMTYWWADCTRLAGFPGRHITCAASEDLNLSADNTTQPIAKLGPAGVGVFRRRGPLNSPITGSYEGAS